MIIESAPIQVRLIEVKDPPDSVHHHAAVENDRSSITTERKGGAMLEGSKLTAGEVMTRDVISVLAHTSIRHVAKLLVEHHISGLPVLDEEQRLIGVVTENDLQIGRAHV